MTDPGVQLPGRDAAGEVVEATNERTDVQMSEDVSSSSSSPSGTSLAGVASIPRRQGGAPVDFAGKAKFQRHIQEMLADVSADLANAVDDNERDAINSRLRNITFLLGKGSMPAEIATASRKKVIQLAQTPGFKECGTLDLDNPDTIPSFFRRFENALKHARTDESTWLDQVFTCPQIGETAKSRLEDLINKPGEGEDILTPDPVETYKTLIRRVLRKYGWSAPAVQVDIRLTKVTERTVEKLRDALLDIHKDQEWFHKQHSTPPLPLDKLVYFFIEKMTKEKRGRALDKVRQLRLKQVANIFEVIWKETTSKDLAVNDLALPCVPAPAPPAPEVEASAAIRVREESRSERGRRGRGKRARSSNDKPTSTESTRRATPKSSRSEDDRHKRRALSRNKECPVCGKFWCDDRSACVGQMKRSDFSVTTTNLKKEASAESYVVEELTHHQPHQTNEHSTRVRLSACLTARNAMIPITIGTNVVMALIDSGATRSFIKPRLVSTTRPCPKTLVEMADSSIRTCDTETLVLCKLGKTEKPLVFMVLDGLTTDCIIGLDIQAVLDISVHARESCVKVAGEKINFLPKKLMHKLARVQTKGGCATRFRELMENPEILLEKRKELQREIDARNANLGAEAENPMTKCKFDPTLDAAELAQARKFVSSMEHCFTSKAKPLGSVKGTYHRVQPTGRPFKMKMRPISPTMLAEQKKQIETMLKHEVIRPSTSDWAMIPCFAPKADGTWRFCVNFAPINTRCLAECYPLPRAPDLLEIFQGCKYFTKLDAAMGYWQVPIHPDDTKYCSFICEEGQFEFLRMPFGLRNAPATYQKLNDRVLKPFLRKTCVVYLDDVIVFSKTFEEHLQHVQEIMTAMAESGQLLRPEKCAFFMKNCEYLGHVVGGGGIRMAEDKYSKILKFPPPKDKQQLKRFLGLVSYYRKFVAGLATLLAPLQPLDKLDPFVWSAESQKIFEQVLQRFNENAVLAHPDYQKEFVIECDASGTGVGAVLMQYHTMPGGALAPRPVLFASRALTKGERKWPPREQEGLAIVWALQQFRHHVLGTHFTVYSDHQSLEWLMTAKTGKLARWALVLAEFEPFTIKYRSGKTNKAADALSRIYEETELLPQVATCFTLAENEAPLLGSIPDEPVQISETLEKWIRSQKALTPSKNHLWQNQRGDPNCLKRLASLSQYKHHVVLDGILGVAVDGTRFKPVLPQSMIPDIVRAYHTSPFNTHLGVKRTMRKIATVFVVPKLRKRCKEVVTTCQSCMERKTPIQKVGWLASKPATRMWSQVAMDFGGPYTTSGNGMKYVLVMIDQFSKYVELVATEKNDAATVIYAFYERIICRHGCPERLLTDNHRQFKNFFLDAVCHAFGCFKSYCSKYYPQGDGHVERFMRNMNDTLSILGDGQLNDWDIYIPAVQFAYNTTVHSVTGITPYFLNHGREPRYPHEIDYSAGTEDTRKKRAASQQVRQFRHVIDNVRERARLAIARAWLVSAKAYNRNRAKGSVRVGDYVMVRVTPAIAAEADARGKLLPRWSKPMLVTEKRSSGNAYQVQEPDTTLKHVFNVSRLLPIPPDSWRIDKQHLSVALRDLATFYQTRGDVDDPHPVRAGWSIQREDIEEMSVEHTPERIESRQQERVTPSRDDQPSTVPDATTTTADVEPRQPVPEPRTAEVLSVPQTPSPHLHEERTDLEDPPADLPLSLAETIAADSRATEGGEEPEVVLGETSSQTSPPLTTEIPTTAADPESIDNPNEPPPDAYPSTASAEEAPHVARTSRPRIVTRRFTRRLREQLLDDGRDIMDFLERL